MELINNLNSLESPEEQYEYLIDLGSALPKLSMVQKTNENRIIGCQNRVWLNLETIENKIIISGESDSRLVSSLIAILIDIYSDRTQDEIGIIGTDWLKDIKLSLSMTRIKGLNSMLNRILSK